MEEFFTEELDQVRRIRLTQGNLSQASFDGVFKP